MDKMKFFSSMGCIFKCTSDRVDLVVPAEVKEIFRTTKTVVVQFQNHSTSMDKDEFFSYTESPVYMENYDSLKEMISLLNILHNPNESEEIRYMSYIEKKKENLVDKGYPDVSQKSELYQMYSLINKWRRDEITRGVKNR